MFYTVVTESCSNLRALARNALKGKWVSAALAIFVYLIAISLPADIINLLFGGEDKLSIMSELYTILVTGPFTLGVSLYCINLFRGEHHDIGQIFYGFERFFKALGLLFAMGFFIFLWTLLLIIPGIVAAYRYSFAFYILVDHPEYGIMKCIEESKKMTKGNKMKIFLLSLTFIGWGILASIPSGILSTVFADNSGLLMVGNAVGSIPLAFLTVYMSVAEIALYEMASGRLRQRSSVIDEPLRKEGFENHSEQNYNHTDSE